MFPYWVPFHLKMVGANLLECRPTAGILKHLFQKLEVTDLNSIKGLSGQVLESTVLPSEVNLFLERGHPVG
jgi:hypothetical protein